MYVRHIENPWVLCDKTHGFSSLIMNGDMVNSEREMCVLVNAIGNFSAFYRFCHLCTIHTSFSRSTAK